MEDCCGSEHGESIEKKECCGKGNCGGQEHEHNRRHNRHNHGPDSGDQEGGCCGGQTVTAADFIRDTINIIHVYKEEEKEGVTTRIDPETAEELVARLEMLVAAIAEAYQE